MKMQNIYTYTFKQKSKFHKNYCSQFIRIREQQPFNEHASCVLALDTVHDCMCCHRLNDDVQSATPVCSKPKVDWSKCNVDCALFDTKGKLGVGICFRDNLEHLIQANSMVFPFVITATKCKATALRQALQIALDLGLNRVVFKSDCQLVVNAVLNNSSYMNELGRLLSNCRTLLFYLMLVML